MSEPFENLAPWPEDDFSAYGPVTERPLSGVQKFVGRFMRRNWLHIPHVTHHDEVDGTSLEERRRNWNAANPDRKITPVAPIIKALALSLRAFPKFGSSLNPAGTKLFEKNYAHIGVAVEVPAGLLVPVIRDCDTKALTVIAAELAEVAERARTKGLSATEMAGGCMTVTSVGHIGGTAFTPIVNAPDVAILGVSAMQIRPFPAAGGEGIEWRKKLPLSLSYDHRIINGADAARFARQIGLELATVEFS